MSRPRRPQRRGGRAADPGAALLDHAQGRFRGQGRATFIFTVISVDGRSNWLEGAQLTGLYLVVAVAAFFVVT